VRKLLGRSQDTYASHTVRGPHFYDPDRVVLPRRSTYNPFSVAEIRFASIWLKTHQNAANL